MKKLLKGDLVTTHDTPSSDALSQDDHSGVLGIIVTGTYTIDDTGVARSAGRQ